MMYLFISNSFPKMLKSLSSAVHFLVCGVAFILTDGVPRQMTGDLLERLKGAGIIGDIIHEAPYGSLEVIFVFLGVILKVSVLVHKA